MLANPLSLAANLVFVYGLATAMWTRVSPGQARLAMATMALQIVRIGVRVLCVGRIYGFVFALGVPVRAVYANALNTAATVQAVARYTWARVRGQPLKWLKTEHAYPARAALLAQKRKLGEILVSSGSVPAAELAVGAGPSERRECGWASIWSAARKLEMEALYQALSFQQGLPLAQVEPEAVPWPVAHALPEHAIRQWQVLPFRIAEQNLFVASPEAPGAETAEALRAFTSLEIRFHLVTPVGVRTTRQSVTLRLWAELLALPLAILLFCVRASVATASRPARRPHLERPLRRHRGRAAPRDRKRRGRHSGRPHCRRRTARGNRREVFRHATGWNSPTRSSRRA